MIIDAQVEELGLSLMCRASSVSADERFMLGLIGSPGSGKSTLANSLVRIINNKSRADISVAVPMDGFHFPNNVLQTRDVRHQKGMPHTFDVTAFVKILRFLRGSKAVDVLCPSYDRTFHEPISDTIAVRPHHHIVIVEGNYLLLDEPPWNQVRGFLDEVWFLQAPIPVILDRLIRRRLSGGSTLEEARQKIRDIDLVNARLIEKTADRADRKIIICDKVY